MSGEFEGGCLCGAVRYASSMAPQLVGDCYCTDCRKASGTSHCTHAVIAQQALGVTGEVRFYDRPADGGNMVSRGFCPECGSAVYSTNSAMPDMAFVRVSSFDDPNLATPQPTVDASRAPRRTRLDRSNPVFQEMMQGGPEAALAEARK
jgi:hypothetical protein